MSAARVHSLGHFKIDQEKLVPYLFHIISLEQEIA
jgi:hypothetical protein